MITSLPHTVPDQADVVIITPLEEERDAVLEQLSGYERISDEWIYYRANVEGCRVIVRPLVKMGRVPGAVATIDAVARWKPKYVILTGIAGGVGSRGIKLGDILIPDQIVDYELQKITPYDLDIRWQVYQIDPKFLDIAFNLRDNEWHGLIKVKRPGGRGRPRRHRGPIASGDKVVAFEQVLSKYQETWSQLIGIEMEAGGVALSSLFVDDQPRFFMVRSVSDLADSKKGTAHTEKWRDYACAVAAAYTIALIKVAYGSKTSLPVLDQKTIASFETSKVSSDFKMLLPAHPHHQGRTAEKRQIRNFLLGKNKAGSFLTIFGIPGMGKTSLVEYVVARFCQKYPNKLEVLLINILEDWTSLVLLRQILSALDISIDERDIELKLRVVIDLILIEVRTRNILLILDGLDHLTDDRYVKAFLRDLRLSGKGKVIITSRSKTSLTSEIPIELQPLPADEARALFVRCWKRQVGDLSPKQVEAVDTICGPSLLEGHPQAITIAGCQADAGEEADELLLKLTRELKLVLQDEEYTAESLWTVIQMAFSKLTRIAQQLLIRLAFFPSKFDADACARVAAVAPQLNDASGARKSLYNAGLLTRSEKSRYSLHSVIRDFAKKQLEELPKDLLKVVGNYLVETKSQEDWVSGLKYLLDIEAWKEVLTEFRAKYGFQVENPKIFKDSESPETILMARAWYVLAYIYDERGDARRALDHAQQGIIILNSPTSDQLEPTVEFTSLLLRFLAIEARNFLRQPNEQNEQLAKNAIDQAWEVIGGLSEAQKGVLTWEIAQSNLLAGVFSEQISGKWDEAEEHYQEALRLYKDLPDEHQKQKTLSNLASVAAEKGDLAGSVRYSREVLASLGAEKTNQADPSIRFIIASEVANLTDTLTKQGKFDEAITPDHGTGYIGAYNGLLHYKEPSLYRPYLVLLINTAILEIESGHNQLAEAEQKLWESYALCEYLEDDTDLGQIFYCLAEIYRTRQAFEQASEYIQKALGCDPPTYYLGEIRRIDGKMKFDQGDYDAALRSLVDSRQICSEEGLAYYEARTCLELARVYQVLGDQEKKEECLDYATGQFERMEADFYLQEVQRLREESGPGEPAGSATSLAAL